jgi:hypothetical protein
MDPMKKAKRKKLEKKGWRVGDAKEFLGLTDDEMALIDTKRCEKAPMLPRLGWRR